MIGKSQIKRVASLHQKKFRKEFGQFIAEGPKVIGELIGSRFSLLELYSTDASLIAADFPQTPVTSDEIKKMSALTTPSGCLAVFEIPDEVDVVSSGITVVLDDVRDPGNLGTIIRLCDWFGVSQIVCSMESVDVFNPKVVQATMGSMARVDVIYRNLTEFLSSDSRPVFGTFMDGKNIYETSFPSDAIVIFGNESNGISEEVESLVTERIAIPRFGNLQKTESLNVATATAITLSAFRRSSKL